MASLADREGSRGAFLFSQAFLPLLLRTAAAPTKDSSVHPPTLIFTGATASVKSNALMSSFSTGKYALRALSQSLGKEFGPQGVHVAHAVIDGVIDIPRTKEWLKDAGPDSKISADGVSRRFQSTHQILPRVEGVGGSCVMVTDAPVLARSSWLTLLIGQIADAYWHLHSQPRSAFTNEIDIRPFCEKW